MLIPMYFRVILFFAIALCSTHAVTVPSASGQETRTALATTLIVDGRVENVFQAGGESLVQVLVQTSDAPRLGATRAARYPAPGEFIYAHVNSPSDGQLTRAARPRFRSPKLASEPFW